MSMIPCTWVDQVLMMMMMMMEIKLWHSAAACFWFGWGQ